MIFSKPCSNARSVHSLHSSHVEKKLEMMCFQNDFLKIEFCLHIDASVSCCVTLMWLCMLLIYNRIFEMFSKAFRLVFSRMGSIFCALLIVRFYSWRNSFRCISIDELKNCFCFAKRAFLFKNIWATSLTYSVKILGISL